MSLVAHLSEIAGEAFSKLGFPAELGEVVPSQRPELAQFQCNGAMSAAKTSGRPTAEIAAEVAAILEAEDEIARVEVASPGFINLTLTDAALAGWAGLSVGDDHLGYPVTETPEHVVVDYAGPNVSKAMHVG
ncbi:MAG: arginine--tRNA ligase, partial [Acidimicrobiia bacterium]